MVTFIEDPSFQVSSIVLSKKDAFTIQDVEVDLKKSGVKDLNQNFIKKVLNRLNDNGIITQNGFYYMLSIKDF